MGDVRLAARGAWVEQRIVECGSLVVRQVGGDRAGEMATHRYLSNKDVTPDDIVSAALARTQQAAHGRHIVAVQDTTEINFSGRDRTRPGLGPAGDGKGLGFFVHPLIAIERDEGAVLGIVDAKVWTRPGKAKLHRHKRALADKESRRWIEMTQSASERLAGAASVVVTGDRESDIFALFVRCPPEIDFVVRAARNRCTTCPETGRKTDALSFEAMRALACVARLDVDLPARAGQPKRTAHLDIRAGAITLARPANSHLDDCPKHITVNAVEVFEAHPPPGVTALHWRLYTTLPVATAAEACEIVGIYRLRWRIEEVFRVFKSEGLDIEATQVEQAGRLFNLAALGLTAAARIIQLRDARDGSARPASDVIDPGDHAAIAAIGVTLEGTTMRQKHPHPAGGLAWLAWIVARLGGWNCYYRPPGPKTMATGWRKLQDRITGYHLANAIQNV